MRRSTSAAMSMVLVVLAVGVTLAACSSPRIYDGGPATADRPGGAAGPGGGALPGPGGGDSRGIGVDLVPLHIPAFVFGDPTPTPTVQSGSKALVGAARTRERLEVLALPSGAGTAAVDFLETDSPDQTWGEVMFPAERSMFRRFARDRSLGAYLVMLTDVDVVGGPDPIPLTAYRWARADVEAYAECGIPDLAFESCTRDFFLRADTRIVSTANLFRGA